MRIRTIKPDFFLHEALFELERSSKLPIRVAFAGLWCAADREGRFKWEPRKLGVQILPYDEIDFSRVLDALSTRGFIQKYTSNGDVFGYVPTFADHQFINNKEKESDLPEPPPLAQRNASSTREPRDDDAFLELESGREGKGKEGDKEGKGKELVVSDKPKAPRLPKLTDEEFIQSLCEDPTYAGINVRIEHGKMMRWCQQSNKTPSQARFVNWINRIDRPMKLPIQSGAVHQPAGQVKTDVTTNDIPEL